MKIRASIIGLGIVVAGVITGSIFALTPKKKPSNVRLNDALTSSQTSVPATQPKIRVAAPKVTTSTTNTTTSTTTAPTTSTSTTPSPTTTPAPEYGLATGSNSLYEVFNKTSVMTSAGIPAAQQTAASTLISDLNANWAYYDSANPTPNLCMMASAKITGVLSDWKTDPVGQLKICNEYAVARYGSWQVALTSYSKTGQF